MKLKEYRIRKGMTQEAVAESVGLTNKAICNYEKGIREPNIDMIKRLADLLDCTVDELLADPEDSDGIQPVVMG